MSTVTSIVVTGFGCVSGHGLGVEKLQSAVFAGRGGQKQYSGRGRDRLKIGTAAFLTEYDPGAHFSAREHSALDLFSQYSLLAAAEAVTMAGIAPEQLSGSDTAVIVGTGIGGVSTLDEGYYALYHENQSRVDVLTIPKAMPSAASGQISIRYGVTGPSFAVSSACASATQAIGIGMMLIQSGAVKRALVGGAEACLTYAVIRAWEAMRVLSPDLCRPFSLGRSGMMLGEGAGIFLIEREDDARKRNAPLQAHLLGYGTTSDGLDLLRPNQAGSAKAMRLALAQAHLTPDKIGYINAHGTGTVANDATESRAIAEVFGQSTVPVSSTKPIHGHALGAAGALELVVSILALQQQRLPPQINLIEPDPACPVHLVDDSAPVRPIDYVLSNSFAFGGVNASLVVGRKPA